MWLCIAVIAACFSIVTSLWLCEVGLIIERLLVWSSLGLAGIVGGGSEFTALSPPSIPWWGALIMVNKHPDAACIIAGDFNKANLKKVLPNFHQHISCPTRGLNTLDHCYTPLNNAYKAHSLPAFGKSDHVAIFLTPEYKQRIAREPPVEREVTRWSPHSEAMLQASLDDVDWDMFRASSSDVSEFTDVAVSFVNTLTEQATETVTIRTFTNQKPWVDRSIRDAVNHRTAAYNAGLLSGNMSEYKTSCYALRHAIRAAKRRYSKKIESHFQLNDSRRMWQGLKTICSSGNKSSAEVRADPLLAVHLLRSLWLQWQRKSAVQRVWKQQTEQQWLCYHLFRGRRSEGTKESERQKSSRTWWDYWPRSEVLCWSACWFVYFHI